MAQGCDMRNIARVVCWELPPSFCALVQRLGRAGRDFTKESEGILIISKATYETGISMEEIGEGLDTVVLQGETEAENGSRQVLEGEEVDEIGARIEHGSDDDEALVTAVKKGKGKLPDKRRKKTNSTFNSLEAKALTLYMGTQNCRREVWDKFFRNAEKRE